MLKSASTAFIPTSPLLSSIQLSAPIVTNEMLKVQPLSSPPSFSLDTTVIPNHADAEAEESILIEKIEEQLFASLLNTPQQLNLPALKSLASTLVSTSSQA